MFGHLDGPATYPESSRLFLAIGGLLLLFLLLLPFLLLLLCPLLEPINYLYLYQHVCAWPLESRASIHNEKDLRSRPWAPLGLRNSFSLMRRSIEVIKHCRSSTKLNEPFLMLAACSIHCTKLCLGRSRKQCELEAFAFHLKTGIGVYNQWYLNTHISESTCPVSSAVEQLDQK